MAQQNEHGKLIAAAAKAGAVVATNKIANASDRIPPPASNSPPHYELPGQVRQSRRLRKRIPVRSVLHCRA
jgi:hypothetical protein